MDVESTIRKLHRYEREVLPLLSKHKTLDDLKANSNLKRIEIMRALQWLQNKNVVELKQTQTESIELDTNGELYLKNGLPERRLLKALGKSELTLTKAKSAAGLAPDELNVSVGTLRKKAAITIDSSKNLSLTTKPFL